MVGQGPQQVDEYTLRAPVGTGLTGTTHLATRPGPDGLQRQVVLKRLDPARCVLLPWAAQLMDELDPHLVCYEAVGPASRGGGGYWVTDVVRRDTLDDVIESTSFRARLRAVLDATRAVAALHARGLVHGHLLPQNVLLRRERSGGVHALVTDAGVRLRWAPALEAPEVALRLFSSLAPEALEALRGGAVDLEAPGDVHALGALLCLLLTGCAPGTAEGERTGAEVLASKARRTYSIGALLDPDDPEDALDLEQVNDLLQRCLDPRPADRPSAPELARGLAAALLLPEPAHP